MRALDEDLAHLVSRRTVLKMGVASIFSPFFKAHAQQKSLPLAWDPVWKIIDTLSFRSVFVEHGWYPALVDLEFYDEPPLPSLHVEGAIEKREKVLHVSGVPYLSLPVRGDEEIRGVKQVENLFSYPPWFKLMFESASFKGNSFLLATPQFSADTYALSREQKLVSLDRILLEREGTTMPVYMLSSYSPSLSVLEYYTTLQDYSPTLFSDIFPQTIFLRREKDILFVETVYPTSLFYLDLPVVSLPSVERAMLEDRHVEVLPSLHASDQSTRDRIRVRGGLAVRIRDVYTPQDDVVVLRVPSPLASVSKREYFSWKVRLDHSCLQEGCTLPFTLSQARVVRGSKQQVPVSILPHLRGVLEAYPVKEFRVTMIDYLLREKDLV